MSSIYLNTLNMIEFNILSMINLKHRHMEIWHRWLENKENKKLTIREHFNKIE